MTDRLPMSRREGGLLEALTSGKPSREAYEGLWLASQLWINGGGVMPMQRYFGLLGTGASLAKATRDVWVRKAAKAMDPCTTPFAQSHELAGQLDQFSTRGPWRTWCKAEHPPAEASKLRQALFYVLKFSDGKPISAQTIYRALLS